MTFDFDNSPMMWSMLTQAGSYAAAMIYGAMRREHTRVWPILALGAILDIAAEVWFVSWPRKGPGMYTGFFLYSLYCMVATIAGIVMRVLWEYAIHSTGSKKKQPRDGNFPPFGVS